MTTITTTTLHFTTGDNAVAARDMAIEAGGHVGTDRSRNAVQAGRIFYDADTSRYTVNIVDNPEDSQFWAYTDEALHDYRVAVFSAHMAAMSAGDVREAEMAADRVQAAGLEMIRRGMW